MIFNARRISQLTFIFTFIGLAMLGKIQLWMAIFFISLASSILLGRFYCGWICPINTVTETIGHLYRKFNIRRRTVPDLMKYPAVRYIILILFLGTMIFILRTGIRLPILPILMTLGLAVTLVYIPEFWHRYLCPYGTMLSVAGKYSKHFWKINHLECISCGICKKTCPGEAIRINVSRANPQISKHLCLSCAKCAEKCPKDAISFQ